MDGVIELARLSKNSSSTNGPDLSGNSNHLDATRPGLSGRYPRSLEKGGTGKNSDGVGSTGWRQGGLVFQPKLGIFEDVAEIDFASMYPTMMAIHNISPETVLCRCCDNHRSRRWVIRSVRKGRGLFPRHLGPSWREGHG